MSKFVLEIKEETMDTWSSLDAFTQAYIEAAFWTMEGEEELKDLGFSEMSESLLKKIISDCKRFQEENREFLTERPDDMNGPDFWLTRNGHGVGFWDRGIEHGNRLTEECKKWGEVDFHAGDDGKIYA